MAEVPVDTARAQRLLHGVRGPGVEVEEAKLERVVHVRVLLRRVVLLEAVPKGGGGVLQEADLCKSPSILVPI